MALGQISPERFKRVSRNFTPLSETVSPTNLPDMTSLTASGRLQDATNTAQKCVKRVRLAKCQIIRRLFSIESPKFYMEIHANLVPTL